VKRHSWWLAGGLVCIAALAAFLFVRNRRAAKVTPTRVVTLAQSVAPDFTPALEALLAPYRASHPDTTVTVRYEPYPKPELHAHDALVALRPLASEVEGEPLFVGNYVVLAYDRKRVSAAPGTWPELVAKAREATRAGAELGVALPEEAYTLLPFFGSALLGPSENAEAATREAFSFLFDLRFGSDLTPHMCPSECAVRLFRERRTPFLLAGEWRIAELRGALGDDLGLARVPQLAAGAPLRSPRTLYGLVRPSDATPDAKAASDALVTYLKSDGRDRLLAETGKLPYPLRRDHGPREAELAELVAEGSVAASRDAVESATRRLATIWEPFAAGALGPNEAARRLVDARP
jgi:ABC-type glycerol-3-phosphate transport system substrate-binding protein